MNRVLDNQFLSDILVAAVVIIVVLGSTLAVGLILIGILGLDFQVNNQVRVGDFFAAISIFTATLLGAIGFKRARDTEKRARTSELISETVSNPVLTESLFEVAKMVNRGYLPEKNSDKRGVRINNQTDEHLMRVLNYYQFLAVSWKKGDTDEAVLYEARGTSVIRTYEVAEDYINERRQILQDDSIYGTLKEFVDRCDEMRKERESVPVAANFNH
ncbi:DUF4760 domain-containing protein [Haladaptatus cibarius]|uniref:DUF4760 domain-containing protein n=1 Tax=Haladaptatus cibarius TaxID=453847 RepID=UPI000679C8C8|nr:DUF4760 domain-containing protein [Haladaptatus cibarius]